MTLPKYILIGLAIAGGSIGRAQTNIFPSFGYVGINTTNPTEPLDIAGVLRLDNPTTLSNYFATLSPRYDSSHPFSLAVENNTGGTASEVLGVYSPGGGGYLNLILGLNGGVGIGTTSPIFGKVTIAGRTGMVPIGWQIGGAGGWEFGPNSGAGTSDDVVGMFSYTYSQLHGNSYLPMQIWNSAGTISLLPGGGNVGIGTTNPAYPLSVNGTIEAKEVIVQSGWSDYVFSPGFHLQPLSEVERTVSIEHHLPGIPSAGAVAKNGVKVGEIEARLLAQIEELTLRLIDYDKRMTADEAEIHKLRAMLQRTAPTP